MWTNSNLPKGCDLRKKTAWALAISELKKQLNKSGLIKVEFSESLENHMLINRITFNCCQNIEKVSETVSFTNQISNVFVLLLKNYLSMYMTWGNSILLCIFSGLPNCWLNWNLESSKVKTGGSLVNHNWNNTVFNRTKMASNASIHNQKV